MTQGYDRGQHIQEQMKKWGARKITHEPIHPFLDSSKKDFEESYAMGRLMEELARPLLFAMFGNSASIVVHCDTTLDSRAAGKRIHIDGCERILPDYEVHCKNGLSFLLDIKSKQCHSYYHLDREVQQFVDAAPLSDYVACAQFQDIPVLVLIHLWPSVAMHAFGRGNIARIHTGVGLKLLSEAHLASLLSTFPVDDHYYLVNAADFAMAGRAGRNNDSYGYYLGVHRMEKGPAPGVLPTLQQWERCCNMCYI